MKNSSFSRYLVSYLVDAIRGNYQRSTKIKLKSTFMSIYINVYIQFVSIALLTSWDIDGELAPELIIQTDGDLAVLFLFRVQYPLR